MDKPDKSKSPDPGTQADSGFLPQPLVLRYCPRCAARNPNVGRKPFECQRCGFTEYFGPVAAVGAIVVNGQGEALMVRRSRDPGKGKWGLPGGFIDPGESAEQAAVREVREETGLNITKLRFLMTLPNQYRHRGVIAPVIDLFFEARPETHDAVSLAKNELDDFEWTWPSEKHLENMAFRSNRLAVEYWLGQQSS